VDPVIDYRLASIILKVWPGKNPFRRSLDTFEKSQYRTYLLVKLSVHLAEIGREMSC
jgi:hypothetical protein